MAAGDFLTRLGTAITLKNTGGTVALTLTSVAAGAGRKSAQVDLGATFSPRFLVTLLTKFGSAPTAGTPVEVYWASTPDGSAYDGGIAAGDDALSDADINKQLQLIGVLCADNTTNAQQQAWMFFPPSRYGIIVVFNGTGQALSGTAGDHLVTLTPLIDQYQSS